MTVLIGGAGSSGTTLLRSILGRHPEIFCGPELSVLNKRKLYTDWRRYRGRLLSPRRLSPLSTDGWFPYASHKLLDESYGWSRAELLSVLEAAPSLVDFANSFFQRALQKYERSMWIEKTPSNSYCFREFLSSSARHKAIHVLRDPKDVVASLVKRGMSPYYSAGLWLYNNSAGLSASTYGDGRYNSMKYEDLVREPSRCVDKILGFLGAEKIPVEVLESLPDAFDESIDSWRNSPAMGISTSSIGSYSRLSEEERNVIDSAIWHIRIRDSVARRHQLPYRNAIDLAEVVGYEVNAPNRPRYVRESLSLAKDLFFRSRRMLSTGLLGYPGSLGWAPEGSRGPAN